MAKEDGGSAFPAITIGSRYDNDAKVYHGGMTLRDYFAGQAIIGLALNFTAQDSVDGKFYGYMNWPQGIAGAAYKIADAMIEEKEKGEKEEENDA
jgi:hypothetical protein